MCTTYYRWQGIYKQNIYVLGTDVKKKWKNLRDSYAKYIRLNKTKTGQAATNRKQWLWFEQMTFFRPFLAFANTSSNVDDIDDVPAKRPCRPESDVESNNDVDIENIQIEYLDDSFIDTEDTEQQFTQSQIIQLQYTSTSTATASTNTVAASTSTQLQVQVLL